MSNENGTIVGPQDNAIARRGFGTQEIERKQETASTAMAERAKAEVQARHIMAMQNPRSVDEARRRILDHCQRPAFAQSARYAKPVGGTKLVGPSIRFVEAALQEYGNVRVEGMVAYDDDQKRTVRVTVSDLERNISFDKDIHIAKTVERHSSKGREVVGQRANNDGKTVYIVKATEDELVTKQGAAESKAIRTLGLRVLPADIVEEAMSLAERHAVADAESDPAATRKKITDSFATIGVYPKNLEEYLGHPLAQCSPAELDDLRQVFSAIRDGEATWQEFLDAQKAERGEGEKTSRGAELLSRRKNGQAKKQDESTPDDAT